MKNLWIGTGFMAHRPIGVLDSGVGGLTVLKRLKEKIPQENYIYFGDTANVPYGEKTQQELYDIVREILDWYVSKNTKAVVMACNTSSAVVLEDIKDEYDFPIFGLIQPTAEYISYSDVQKVGVISTTATANSHAYKNAINAFNPEINVIETACPGLVEIVESNKINTYEAKQLIIKYVAPLLESNVEKIILGCTHYPYLKDVINSVTTNKEMLIDPAEYLTQNVVQTLTLSEMLNTSGEGIIEYFVTSNAPMFEQVGKIFLKECSNVHEINLQSNFHTV